MGVNGGGHHQLKGPGDAAGASPHKPLRLEGDLKLAAITSKRRAHPSRHITELLPSGGGMVRGAERDLETQAQSGLHFCAEILSKSRKLQSLRLHCFNSGENTSHLTDGQEGLDEDMCVWHRACAENRYK